VLTAQLIAFQFALDRIAAWCSECQSTSAGIDVHINRNKLPEVSSVKDLGVTFDNLLS